MFDDVATGAGEDSSQFAAEAGEGDGLDEALIASGWGLRVCGE